MLNCFDDLVLSRRFVRMCRRNLWRTKVADSSGMELTGGGLLAGALALGRFLHREVFAADEQHVGVLLPTSVPAIVVNAAVALDRRIAVNLNYTVTSEILNSSIAQCGIRHVLTTRRLFDRFPLKLDAELVYVEDLKKRVRWSDKLAAAAAWVAPAMLLERWLGLAAVRPDDVVTVMFTSGSTGVPKGVVLTHANIGANLTSINKYIHFVRRDVLLGILPIFHSFGYTVTMWTALVFDLQGAYHFTPLEPRQLGLLCRKQRGTILIATPTFLRSYLRRCDPEDLKTLEVVVAGAEKLSPELAAKFHERFGVLPVEGYGATELSPVVSGNEAPHRDPSPDKTGNRSGTIGRALQGIEVKVVDLDTGDDLPCGRQGMLLVRGKNVMQGYLNRPDLTAEVMRGDWYVTGDVASIDADGFITIVGRISRFSKIGGEMVPHIGVETALVEALSAEDREARVAVTAVADESRGERLIVLHTGLHSTPAEICRAMVARGVPPLWIPSPGSFRQVSAIPLLGTGKLDLTRLKELAEAEFCKSTKSVEKNYE